MAKTISIEELTGLKKTLERKKGELSELKGRLGYLMGELKTAYSCDTVEQAEALLEQKVELLRKKKEVLDTSVLQLSEEYSDLLSLNLN